MHGVIIILVIHLILKFIPLFYGFKRDYLLEFLRVCVKKCSIFVDFLFNVSDVWGI